MVENGVPCGSDRFCIQGRCEPIENYFECYADCGEHGVCNNHGSCSCDCGWEGDDCSKLAWCHEKFTLAYQLMIGITVLLLLIMLIVYLLLVFKYDRAWNHPFTVESKTGPSIEVKSGSYDRYGQKELENLLPNKDNPSIIKPERPNSKTIKNKGYEDWKIKNQSNRDSPGAQVISDSEFQALKRKSSISESNPSFPPLPLTVQNEMFRDSTSSLNARPSRPPPAVPAKGPPPAPPSTKPPPLPTLPSNRNSPNHHRMPPPPPPQKNNSSTKPPPPAPPSKAFPPPPDFSSFK